MVRVRASLAGGLFIAFAAACCTSFGATGDDGSDASPPPADGATTTRDGGADALPHTDAGPVADAACSADLANDGRNCGECGVSCFGATCSRGLCETSTIAKLRPSDGAFAVTRDAIFVATDERILGQSTGIARLPKDVAQSSSASRVDAGLAPTGASDLAVVGGKLFAARVGGSPIGVLAYGGGTSWTPVHGLATSWLFPAGEVLLGTAGPRFTAYVMNETGLLASGSLASDGPRFCSLAKVGATVFGSTNVQGVTAGKAAGSALPITTTTLELAGADSQRAPILSASDGTSGVMVAQYRTLDGTEGECTSIGGGGALYRFLDTTPPSMRRLYELPADKMVRSVAVYGPTTYLATVTPGLPANGSLERCDDAGICRVLLATQLTRPLRERSLVKEGALLFFRIEDEIRLVDARRQ